MNSSLISSVRRTSVSKVRPKFGGVAVVGVSRTGVVLVVGVGVVSHTISSGLPAELIISTIWFTVYLETSF